MIENRQKRLYIKWTLRFAFLLRKDGQEMVNCNCSDNQHAGSLLKAKTVSDYHFFLNGYFYVDGINCQCFVKALVLVDFICFSRSTRILTDTFILIMTFDFEFLTSFFVFVRVPICQIIYSCFN